MYDQSMNHISLDKKVHVGLDIPYFFNQTPRLLFFFAACFCAATIFKAGVYFFGKFADINIGHVQAIQ